MHKLVLEPNIYFLAIMARRAVCGERNIHATISDVYPCKEATHDDQLTACFQLLEERVDWFDDQLKQCENQIGAQLEVLTKQFPTMGGANCRIHIFHVDFY
jgi:hypothetical protein